MWDAHRSSDCNTAPMQTTDNMQTQACSLEFFPGVIMKNRATTAGEHSHFKNKKISIHARTLPVFVLNPHSPRRKGNEQEVHKHALLTPAQLPFREHKQFSELNISSAEPNLYPALFTKQYQGLFLRASRGKSTA